jgi:hypothetical protein
MGKWAEPELTFGFVADSLPVIPSFVRHLAANPVFSNLVEFARSRQRSASPSTKGGGEVSQLQKEDPKKKKDVITDIEYYDLVHTRTDSMSIKTEHTEFHV